MTAGAAAVSRSFDSTFSGAGAPVGIEGTFAISTSFDSTFFSGAGGAPVGIEETFAISTSLDSTFFAVFFLLESTTMMTTTMPHATMEATHTTITMMRPTSGPTSVSVALSSVIVALGRVYFGIRIPL